MLYCTCVSYLVMMFQEGFQDSDCPSAVVKMCWLKAYPEVLAQSLPEGYVMVHVVCHVCVGCLFSVQLASARLDS